MPLLMQLWMLVLLPVWPQELLLLMFVVLQLLLLTVSLLQQLPSSRCARRNFVLRCADAASDLTEKKWLLHPLVFLCCCRLGLRYLYSWLGESNLIGVRGRFSGLTRKAEIAGV